MFQGQLFPSPLVPATLHKAMDWYHVIQVKYTMPQVKMIIHGLLKYPVKKISIIQQRTTTNQNQLFETMCYYERKVTVRPIGRIYGQNWNRYIVWSVPLLLTSPGLQLWNQSYNHVINLSETVYNRQCQVSSMTGKL